MQLGSPSVATRQRIARQQAFREQLSAHTHYRHMNEALQGMHAIASQDGDIDQSVKDRFSMYASIADKHWRVVEKYLPATPPQATGTATPGASQLQSIVAALLAPKHDSNASADTASHVSEHSHSSDEATSNDDSDVVVAVVVEQPQGDTASKQ